MSVTFTLASLIFNDQASGRGASGAVGRSAAIGAPAGAPGFAGPAGGAGVAVTGGGIYGVAVNTPLGTPFVPISLFATPTLGTYPFGALVPYTPPTLLQQMLGMAAAAFPACLSLLTPSGPMARPKIDASNGLDAAEKVIDQAPPEPIKDLSPRDAENYGKYGTSQLAARGGTCQKFYDKNFNLSGWGIAVREHMKEHPKAFTEVVPRDIDNLCPSFRMMSAAQREAFWVEFFAALATPESQCNASAENHNAPHGTAKGLYQLFEPLCPPTDASNLLDPYKNIDCAVGKFAKELETRQSIMSDSRLRSREGVNMNTYWGTLRLNPAAVDAGAASTFKNEVRNFPGCKPTQVSSL